ncbi:hypothetical protein C7974DRAFT_119598 [Boeremia exigua]|uniref:uncharacterized protein n=1 Tax=Boeremia exigua TaxID=749465 RepID=UPI001E8E873F|nr:uncharacterized protein C7974DRAFT_119598 [Boeremia exigua]KAH6643208.1 hypothetical protein C7974DRAFT_119598 [Boeremia exigua]
MNRSPAPRDGLLSRLASRLKKGGRRRQKTSTIPVPATASGPSASKDTTPLSTDAEPTSSAHNTGLLDLAPIALSALPSTKDGIGTAAIPPPSDKVASTAVCSATPLSLWEEAYNQAYDQAGDELKAWLEKNASEPKTDDHIAELVELVRCSEEKHQKEAARLTIGNREILWRDYAERVVSSVTAIGDIAINFAPAPSSAAWSAVKVLLNTNVSERKDLVVIMGCSEVVLRLYRRGKVYEKVYIANSPGSDIFEELERKMIEVYKSCFEFLAFVATEIQKGNGSRFLDALLDPGRGEERVSEMKDFEQQLDSTAHACEIEMNDENRKLLQSLESPLKRVDKNVVDVLQKLEKSEREEAMNYISTIPVGVHHQEKLEKRTKDTCEWLTSHSEFHKWEDSACSSILWLRGDSRFYYTTSFFL